MMDREELAERIGFLIGDLSAEELQHREAFMHEEVKRWNAWVKVCNE